MNERFRKTESKGLVITWKGKVKVLKTCYLQSSGLDFLVDDYVISPSQE